METEDVTRVCEALGRRNSRTESTGRELLIWSTAVLPTAALPARIFTPVPTEMLSASQGNAAPDAGPYPGQVTLSVAPDNQSIRGGQEA